MVEVDIQFLAGVAVTVFLALMFFGVVVLWDVALALRSVGDKIDKLEDNVDDDLTEIGHSLDGMSSGGGGTQLHLSGGTISSGPNQGQPQQSAAGASQQGPAPGGAGHSQAAQGHPQDAQPGAGAAGSRQGPAQPPDADRLDRESGEGTPGERPSDEPDSRPVDEAPTDEPADRATADSDVEEELEDEHPRAAANRNRFVTSPYLAPWYAMPLDREATEQSEPRIAGALESGDVFAADPEEMEDGEEPIVATAPGGEYETDEDTGTSARGADSIGDGADDEGRSEAEPPDENDEGSGESVFTFETDDDESAAGSSRRSEPTDGSDDDADPEAAPSDGDSDRDSRASRRSDRDGESEDVKDDSGAHDGSDGAGAGSSEEGALAGDDADDGGTGGTDGGRSGDAGNADGSDARTAGESDADEANGSTADGDDAAGVGREAADDEERITDFELADVSELADEESEDVTVEDAVDSMNDETPALSLSSHDFEVSAEADDESATLLFEFDPASVELTDSTRRLLRYQLRSFAGRESTPDGDVTVEGQTLLVELPTPDGNAIQRWGEAAVSVIDRTLYLSDDSE